MSERPRLDVGTLLNDRYEIVRLLGKGGMGEVYLARDTRIHRNVALKVLRPELASQKEGLGRFAVEAQAVSALNHPHIMTIYEVDTASDGTFFFVAEYNDGKTLNHLVRAKLSLDQALDIAIQVASALSAAHEAGITHRDIKPENIMVRRDGYIKVLDFGLAKLSQQQRPSSDSESEDPTKALLQTKPGAVMGTAPYMSPEQARGLPVDARSDIWSLGVVIYEMVTGRKPFLGETTADLMVSILSSKPPLMSSFVAELPPELEWIVSKAISKNPDERYQTSKELRTDLEKIRKQIEFTRSFSSSVRDVHESQRNLATSEHPTLLTGAGTTAASTARHGLSDVQSSPGFKGVLQRAKAHKLLAVSLAVILIAVVSSGLYFVFINKSRTWRVDSIAVLPFENLSGDPELAYLTDGLSDHLIDRLSQLPQLRVISRNSSFKFRGANIDPRDVASQLGVRVIVTGSIARIADDLSIRVNIIDGIENRHLTGWQYRRKANDLVGIQNEIAQKAAEQLRLRLNDSQSKRFGSNGTENSDAYRFYLSGLVELNGPQDVHSRALEYFEQAVKLDPDFAAAHTEIAWVYWSQANGSGDPNKLMLKAKAATEQAMAIDPDLAKAHVLQAMMKEYEFDWADAEKEYKRAIELSPNLDFAHNNYAFFLSVLGRQNEALAELEQQRIRDPINQRLALLQRGIILTQARRFDEALHAYQEAQAVEPARDVPNFSLGYAYGGKGLYNEAANYYKKSADLLGGEDKYSQPLVYLAATYAKMPGKRNEARAILTKIERMDQYVSPALLAIVYSALDDNDKAMTLLEQAYIKRDLLLRFIGTGYEYDGLRDNPRFADLIKRMGLSH